MTDDRPKSSSSAVAALEHDGPRSPSVLAERLKERIYAGLTVVAVTLGLVLTGGIGAGGAALSVAGTAIGLWLATVAADQLAHGVAFGRLARGADLRHMVFVTSPLLSAALGPLLLIGLSALGVMPLDIALYVSVGVDLASLFVWGLVLGRRMGAGWLAGLLSGAVNFAIGCVVIAVKLLAGH